ncbi:MAG: enolase C-terminal domain-like protein, partial [Myxococcota bacterium]
MKITQVSRHPYRLRFNRPLVTGRGTVSERYGQLLIAESDDGSRGSGDVCPWPGFGSDDPDAVHRNFEAIVDGPNALDGVEFQTPADVDSWLRASSWAPEIRAAYELALLDLLGQRADRPIARLLSPDPDRSVPVHQLVNDALDTPLMAHAVKLKVGQNLARDLERTRAVRDRLGPDTPIRLDANGSWTVPDAIEALESFAPIGIEFVEQPVASLEGLAEVRAHSPIAIAADESVRDAASLDAIIDAKAADLVVLKPAFLGGIIASQRLA